MPASLQRAGCFYHLLSHKELWIGEGELIVGERGPAPKAVPTYPEICLHSQADLKNLNDRKKVSFRVDEGTSRLYDDLIRPFWKGRSNRDRIMSAMNDRWKKAYLAGIFTEFQEQRAPGHTAGGEKIFSKGLLDLKQDITDRLAVLEGDPGTGQNRQAEELRAMDLAADALIMFAGRHAEKLEALSLKETGRQRKKELTEMARICRKVPAHSPHTFHEALQHYWFIHLGVISELNPWDSFNPGRLDQHLYPFYARETNAGSLDRDRAAELLQCFWIKFNNHPAPPKVGITAQESNTYTDFTLINLGGVDRDGNDAVNELTYLILDVIEEMRLIQPGSMVQISRKNPDAYVRRAIDIIRTGFGQPSFFNSEALVAEMTRQGKSIDDARTGGASGCVETGSFGKECYVLTGYFNLPKILEITLNNGTDPVTGLKIGPDTGNPREFRDFTALMDAFHRQLNYFIDIKIEGNDAVDRIFAEFLPAPFLSLLIDDCIVNGRDYNAGGARYNSSYIQFVGVGSLTDSLAALRHFVFEEGSVDMAGLLESLAADFSGRERLRYALLNDPPKYGNDDDKADELLVRVFDWIFDAVDGRPVPRGGCYRMNLLPTTCHIYFGKVTGALPDGRKSGQPLSEGISPVQGADRHGPTSVLKSAARIDHLRTGGTLLNQKFTPSFFDTAEGREKLKGLIRSYFSMNGHHIQFNVVSADTLRRAQKEPGLYRDLIVRVAGYSDYFNDLGKDLQDEIIRRTEHGLDP